MYRNMKITISPNSPLPEVIQAVEALGYTHDCTTTATIRSVNTHRSGTYGCFGFVSPLGVNFTLGDLKLMLERGK